MGRRKNDEDVFVTETEEPREKTELEKEMEDPNLMDIPMTFDEAVEYDIRKLPVSDDGIKSLILSGISKRYPAYIPVWNLKKQRVERQKIFVSPISMEDWDYCVGYQDKETGFMTLVLARCLYDEHGNLLTLEEVRGLPVGVAPSAMKEIRKLSGHFEAGLF